MPIQVRGVLVQAMSGAELSRVRTEFRLRLPEPINKSSLESRGPTLLCNHVDHPASRDSEKGMVSVKELGSVRTDALQFSPQPWPRLLPASSPPPGEMRPYGVRSPALLLAQGIGGDAQALHQFADRIPQIYPSLSPPFDTNCFRSRIALFLDTKAQTISFSSAK